MFYRIHEADNVAVALDAAVKGGPVILSGAGDTGVTALSDIPKGHKVTLRAVAKGDPVIKYGSPVGIAAEDLPAGSWVHDHNLRSLADEQKDYEYHPVKGILPGNSRETFLGYRRESGKVGVRNYIGVISGSFCTNTHIRDFVRMAEERFPKTENFDGFLALTHECGCGQMGDDLVYIKKIVSGLMEHPNFSGILFVELGCENTQYDTITPYLEHPDKDRIIKIRMQDVEDEYEAAMEALEKLYAAAVKERRTPCPLSELHIAENCGGSDGFSGITGNRLAGRLTDRFIGTYGGTVNMTEVPEMFGAEQFLMNRAKDEKTFQDVVWLIQSFKDYIAKYGASANGNPSFGNRQGGISTIEDKSMGCCQKSGTCTVTGVVPYAERAKEKGLNLVWGPGSDLVGVTAQIVAGAQIVLFITGRGTPVAYAAPTLKVATNTAVFERKRAWMDFNAGTLLDGVRIDDMEQELFDMLIACCEGRYRASNERAGFYQIGILKEGVTL